MLARLANEIQSPNEIEEGNDFASKITTTWDKYNDQIFSYYNDLGFVLPDFWLAYPVHARTGLIPFSDPLTIIIKPELDEVVATLVHELCHVFFAYIDNKKQCDSLWSEFQPNFPSEDFGTQVHLIVNILAASGLYQIFGQQKAEELLSIEKHYPGLERAWEIIDRNKVDFTQPMQAILNLKIS